MKHRTALITAASIAAVVFAGAVAIGANMGILTVADSTPVGQLSAATVAAAHTTTPPAQQLAAVKTKTSSDQKYVIRQAGAVKLRFSKTNLRLADVSVKKHWTWTLEQTGDTKLTVTFKHGSESYTFVARLGRGGKVTAKVDHPVTKVVPAASSTGSSGSTWAVSPAPSTASPAAPTGGGSHEGGGDQDD